MVVVGSLDNQT